MTESEKNRSVTSETPAISDIPLMCGQPSEQVFFTHDPETGMVRMLVGGKRVSKTDYCPECGTRLL